MFPCCWCRLDREGWAGRLGQEGQAEGRQAPRCEWGCRESCGVLLPEPPGACLGGGGGGGRAADPALAAARPGAGAPLRPQRPGPARPAASAALWPARRGLGRTPKLSPGGRGQEARTARSRAGTGRASTQPTGECLHRPPRPRGAARGGPQSWHKTKVRVRGVGAGGGRGGAGGHRQPGAPRCSRRAGLAGGSAAPPWKEAEDPRAPRSDPRRSRRVQIAACQGLQPGTHVRGARPQSPALRSPAPRY